MSTWEIMLGFEALTTGVSFGAILYFMFKKEPAENAAPKPAAPSILGHTVNPAKS